MIYGIVLAGGYSSRAKQNKMMLQINGRPLIHHTILSMIHCVDKIIVVTGNYHEDIKESLNDFSNVTVVRNKEFDKGMFSSVKTGVRQIDDDCFIVPGDCPNICQDVYSMLLQATGEIRVPTYNHKRGHPIFIKNHLIEALLQFDDTSNLKLFRDSNDVKYYETDCLGILKDIDTISDYNALIERNEKNGD